MKTLSEQFEKEIKRMMTWGFSEEEAKQRLGIYELKDDSEILMEIVANARDALVDFGREDISFEQKKKFYNELETCLDGIESVARRMKDNK